MIHVGYNRPELFRVLMNNRFSKPQAAVMSFSRAFDFGPLNATVKPADGQLYVVGIQVWGTTAFTLWCSEAATVHAIMPAYCIQYRTCELMRV